MKNTLLLALCLVALSNTYITKAHAEETKTDPNVSTVQGQVVPVGDVNKYTYDYKKWNIWTNPFGLFYGSFPLGISYAPHRNFKLNVEPQGVYTYNTNAIRGFGVTLSGSIFFKKVYDGFYLEPGYRFLYLDQENTNNSGSVNAIQLIGGWGWVWDAGLNINVGLGVGRYFGDFNNDDFEGTSVAGNLQFGYTF